MADNGEAELTLAVLAGVPDIGDTFRHADPFEISPAGQEWRERWSVHGWAKRRPPWQPPEDLPAEMREFFAGLAAERRADAATGPDKVAMQFCGRADAEYVYASNGLCSLFFRVRDVHVSGRVDYWDAERWDYQRHSAELLDGEPIG